MRKCKKITVFWFFVDFSERIRYNYNNNRYFTESEERQ